MALFRPRPQAMATSRQLGRPAHDATATAAVSLSVKASSEAAAASEFAANLGGDLSDEISVIRQRLDDADIP